MPLAKDFRRSPVKTALKEKYHVMSAVVLRDIRTRFFDHGLGFFIVPLWPLAHMLVLLAIYRFTGRTAPYGESLNLYFATGLVPTLLFVYVSRFMAYSLLLNKPMLSFPVVRPLDIMFGRAYLEIIGAALTLAMLIALLLILGEDPWPVDLDKAVLAYLAALLLSVGVGMLVGVITLFMPFFITLYSLAMIPVYILSGTLFAGPLLPEQLAYPLSWSPVFQCVEWVRSAYFPTYDNKFLDPSYVLWAGGGALFLGLFLERTFRMKLMEG